MKLRTVLFIGLCAGHALLSWIGAGGATLGPAIAATIYAPLFVLDALRLPVFGNGPSGGWAGPSPLGWACVLLLWGAVWWGVATLLARACRR
ncbi:hypothetical protein [Massilia aquatica]|uniref:Uncharacterized protein n=1 Tax=Massilia aquatica TaxID=2609000 RepID=A0ABX0MJE5_9BURK|nr:hypothetical protein [Massilia aquatica]NHZ44988.1 hypothetical protein [Massilia aquatica]